MTKVVRFQQPDQNQTGALIHAPIETHGSASQQSPHQASQSTKAASSVGRRKNSRRRKNIAQPLPFNAPRDTPSWLQLLGLRVTTSGVR